MAALALVPGAFLAVAMNTVRHHFRERAPADPPYMEFSLLLIGLGGVLLLWVLRPSEIKKDHDAARWRWPALSILSAVLTVTATLGWWATEVQYARQVIYSYDSQWTTTAPAPQ